MPLPKAKTESWGEALSRGPWVEALCIGVDAYEHLKILNNAVGDASAIAHEIQGMSQLHHCTPPHKHTRTTA